MPAGGRLTVETANVPRPAELGDEGDRVLLRVRDEGSGMDEETRRRLADLVGDEGSGRRSAFHLTSRFARIA